MQSSLYASYRTVEENKTVVKTIPSYEIAEMMDRKHSEVLRMLEGSKEIIGIIPTLENAELVSQDYFIESTYKVEGNNKKYLNTVQKILVEGTSKTNENVLTGRTDTNKVVNFEGKKELIGQVIDVKIIKDHIWYLEGEI